MELYKWFWVRRVRGTDFAQTIGVTAQSVSNLSNRRYTPTLLTALKIYKATNGEVTPEELLNPDELKELNECECTQNVRIQQTCPREP
jgi:DNA-binding XRE family transcriptional regulator